MKEFLRLDNKVIIELKIKPLSPLCIKLSSEEEENDKSSTYSSVLSTEGGKTEARKTEANKTGDLECDTRRGEIYIPGSSLKGLFRDRFVTMYKSKSDFIKNLFGYIDNNKKAKKSRIFLQDAFLFEEEKRKVFYDNNKFQDTINDAMKEFIKTRSITPIDSFTAKAVAPLRFEYTTEDFRGEILINNAEIEEIQGIYFIIRDSINGEIRIGNSKTRGFGKIKFEVSNFKYSVFRGKEEKFEKFERFFEIDDKSSTKVGDNYFEKVMKLKDEFKEINLDNPNDFIKALFSEVK